ncbi:hypothetical protein BGX16_1677 [Hallerella succinigenes]|uniref:Uncharacterized protein n=1 Tax=Hallerella succinigenes TaxID=1896222 RepID=A0A2M9A7Q6_9BACT|nr:hypothetical protein BGX16_1677 [Hallerella succinigenes]
MKIFLEVPGEIRKQLFLDSDTAKKAHYAEVLDNKEKFGDIWNVDELSVLVSRPLKSRPARITIGKN